MWNYICNFVPRLFDSTESKVQEHIVFTLIGLIGFLVLAWHDLTYNPGAHFDAQGYGLGIGGLLTGCGAAAWGKSKLSPPTDDSKQ